ncbi:MAG: ROK family transcriptional regulator [Gemmataceae bacterium]|nr:ROK family transcriptional regulator [Gemmataceae bacterium]
MDTARGPSLLGRMSEGRVLRALQARGPLSRAEVSRHAGLSAPAVSRAVASLLRSGLLEEGAEAEATGGRPALRLRLANASSQVVGIAVDTDSCLLVSAGLDGVPHGRPVGIDTPETYEGLIDALARAARRISRPGAALLGVGLSLPGLIDSRTGRGVLSPNLPMTDGRCPAADLAEALGVECRLLQESHALCLAEMAHGHDDFAVLDVHTGVGLGVVSGGRLLAGHRGMAGEIGHVTVVPDGRACACGNRGCLETVANDASLAWRVSKRLGRKVGLEQALGLATLAELDDACKYLAVGVAAVVNLFNPARLFVHGRLFDADPALFDRMVKSAAKRALKPPFADCSIQRATGTKWQGAVAGIIQHVTGRHSPEVRHAP